MSENETEDVDVEEDEVKEPWNEYPKAPQELIDRLNSRALEIVREMALKKAIEKEAVKVGYFVFKNEDDEEIDEDDFETDEKYDDLFRLKPDEVEEICNKLEVSLYNYEDDEDRKPEEYQTCWGTIKDGDVTYAVNVWEYCDHDDRWRDGGVGIDDQVGAD